MFSDRCIFPFKILILSLLSVTSLKFLATYSYAQSDVQVYAVDGDTFTIDHQKIRLWGVDAPEILQKCNKNGVFYSCGLHARIALEEIVNSGDIRCEEKPRARSETRIVARCFVGDQDLGWLMVKSGWAIDYEYFSKGFYKDAQNLVLSQSLTGFKKPCNRPNSRQTPDGKIAQPA